MRARGDDNNNEDAMHRKVLTYYSMTKAWSSSASCMYACSPPPCVSGDERRTLYVSSDWFTIDQAGRQAGRIVIVVVRIFHHQFYPGLCRVRCGVCVLSNQDGPFEGVLCPLSSPTNSLPSLVCPPYHGSIPYVEYCF